MKCPDCHLTLQTREIEPGLSAGACGQCGGEWVAGIRYFRWLETQRKQANIAGASPHSSSQTSHARALHTMDRRVCPRPCPACGRLLVHAKVGRGLPFELDRCGGCGGFWFDAGEWAALKRLGLHDDVHFVFSATWQADVAREDREGQRDSMSLNNGWATRMATPRRARA